MRFDLTCTTSNPRTVTGVEFDAETLPEFIDQLILFLRGAGFHPESIKDHLGDMS